MLLVDDYKASDVLPYQQTLLSSLPQLQIVMPSEIANAMGSLKKPHVVISDLDLYLQHRWPYPTIVLATESQVKQIISAWSIGAVTCWLKEDLPADFIMQLQRFQTQHNSKLIKNQDIKDLPIAANFKQKLLPLPATFERFKFEYGYLASSFLSGDWLDYWQTDEAHVLFYVADVSGHGVCSSILSNWLMGFRGSRSQPEDLLTLINTRLIALNTTKHITMFAGLLNFNTGELKWCSAGQYPPAIIVNMQSNEVVSTLENENLPLGLAPALGLVVNTVFLEEASSLIVSSDGVLEVFNGSLSEQFVLFKQSIIDKTFIAKDPLPDDLTILKITKI